MAQLNIPPLVLLLPLLFVGALVGFRRSWARETVTGLVLAVILVGFDRLVVLVRALLRILARAVEELAGAAGVRTPNLTAALERLPVALVVLVCAIIFLIGAYWLGNVLGNKGATSRVQRATGAGVGVLNTLLLLAILSARAEDILGASRLRRLFLVPGSGRGVDVQVSALPSSAVLAQWSAFAVVVLVLIAFAWGVTRLPRLIKS